MSSRNDDGPTEPAESSQMPSLIRPVVHLGSMTPEELRTAGKNLIARVRADERKASSKPPESSESSGASSMALEIQAEMRADGLDIPIEEIEAQLI